MENKNVTVIEGAQMAQPHMRLIEMAVQQDFGKIYLYKGNILK